MGVPGIELVEADSRKCAFLREAARVTAAGVTIHQARIEAVRPGPRDVVTARGCAPLERLLTLADRFIGPQTECLFLKGERAADEVEAAQEAWSMRVTVTPSRADPRGAVLQLTEVGRARIVA